jgi:predicted ATP-grasp superfamily ATP-dependent carboligase
LDGFVSDSPDDKSDNVFLVCEPQVYQENEDIKKHNFPKPHTGFISGLSGAIMNEALLSPIEGISLLVPISSPYPDPGGAARLIEGVNKIKALDINVSKLNEDAEKIQRSFMELAEKNRQVSQQDALGPSKGLYV